MKTVTEQCICGGVQGALSKRNGLDIITCSRCGTIRQNLKKMTLTKLSEFYDKYHSSCYDHSLEHDVSVSRKRLKAYKLQIRTELLDIGSGSGAFITQARKQKVNAVGVEICKGADKSGFVYEEPLEKVHFPTDHFDYITSHDCLEHSPVPIRMLEESFRILKQNGTMILDFPNFFSDKGKHHWKLTEHIWLFSEEQLKDILIGIGFKIKKVKNPIASKIVIYVTKPKQKRVKILVPPGTGDIYWSLIKIKSFCEKNDLGIPDVRISSQRKDRQRSIEYVRRCPFVNCDGYEFHGRGNRPVEFAEAYREDKRNIFKNVAGCDWFIAFNGAMRYGKSIDMLHTQYETDWMFPMWESLEERKYASKLKEKIGDYIVAYFVPHGMYKHWLADIPTEKIKELLVDLYERTGKKIVLVGAGWDKDTFVEQFEDEPGFLNLIGKTSLPECFSLMRYASGVIGFPSGITILATRFKTPTVMFWNDYFDKGFFHNSCPPQAYLNWYDYVNTKEENADRKAVNKLMGLMSYEVSDKLDVVRKYESISEPEEPEVREAVNISVPTNRPVTVACVLKSGGDFTKTYVEKLMRGAERCLKNVNYEFVCLTDRTDIKCCRTIPLENDWPGWWSKIELFRPGVFTGKIIYFDLDTVLIKNISELAGLPRKITMLKAFNPAKNRASGIMIWKAGDYDFIYKNFEKNPNFRGGDQDYIVDQLKRRGGALAVQRTTPVASYKHHCQEELPKDARIVCFHGKPRPNRVKDEWMKEYWK